MLKYNLRTLLSLFNNTLLRIMKSFTFFIFIFLLVTNSFGQAFKKLADSEVNSSKIEIAKKFANFYLAALKNDSFYQFKDEAVDILKNQLTEERQKASYKQIKDMFGDFKSLDYTETWIQKDDTVFKILRFKGDFEKSDQKLEIRVILNDTNKIAGFWIKPWSDMLQ